MQRARPGLEFALLLRRLMDERPVEHATGHRPPPLSKRHLASFTGMEERTVSNWLNGFNLPDESNVMAIERALFGKNADTYRDEIKQLRAAARNGRLQRSMKGPLPEALAPAASRRIFSDAASELPNLGYADLDLLPVAENWRFQEIRYGEGVQSAGVAGSRLLWLESTRQMLDSAGMLRPLTGGFPESGDALEGMAREWEIFFPRRVVIVGSKERDTAVRLFACTDMAYPQGLDDNPGDTFSAEALLGRGGLAAFMERSGALFTRTHGEIGNGYGCAVALIAVAYRHRHPVYRSPYCMVIRKGIRYPDDVWLSPATGRPVLSGNDPASARFLFQSREAKGGSTDMFAANFNGSGLVNLNADDESAWDGFVDEAGNDLTSWQGRRVTFASTVTGKGFIEAITREDGGA
ncbi:MAG: hypothetical protein LBF16_03395 [Pseudomonadales bacterium]|jgi:transcriptional regulator with XRE-family HTH domain|nr:hypothetical protein [Pseudomonadales bacterium]